MQTNSHLSRLIHDQAAKYGDREELIYKDFGGSEWKSMSWNQFSATVKQVSNAMLNLGVKVQENVGVFSQNSVQYLFCDFGAWGIRAVTIPFYATSSEQQIQFMISDAKIRFLFVGEQEQYDKAHRVIGMCKSLERIIIFDKNVRIAEHDTNAIYFDDFLKMGENYPRQSEVEVLQKGASFDDIANILYTSGTTGDSKGVILTMGQYHAAFEANNKCVPVGEKDRVLNFLPFTHIFEKGWKLLSLTEGATLIVNTYPQEVQKTMRETHPTAMSSVPRFWEKVYMAVMEKIEASSALQRKMCFWEKVYMAVMEKIETSSALQRKMFLHALAVGKRHNIDYLSKGKRPPIALHLEYEVIDKTIFSLVRKELGLTHPHFFPTAGATVNPKVEEFVHAIGINMIVGYGLTESLATVSCNHLGEPFTVGGVGVPIEGIDVKISNEGEVLLKGPTITRGYYNREDLTKAAFTADGYFKTGDSGYLKDGELFLKERIKDLFKTSNGKYIALYPLLEEYAREHGISFETREDLCRNEQIHQMMMDRIDTLQQQLAHYEQVKRFTLLPHSFSLERGELTNTLKIKRRVLNQNYAKEIEAMYEE